MVREFDKHFVVATVALAELNAGSRIPTNNTIMLMTTSSSIKVNADGNSRVGRTWFLDKKFITFIIATCHNWHDKTSPGKSLAIGDAV